MERFRSLVGKLVEAHYRSGDFYLSAAGTLVSDNGRSIVLQEKFSSGGNQKTIRVEIPYAYIARVTEAVSEPVPVSPAPPRAKSKRT
jgi:hypothetical protein